jgi:hypothetical protein
MHRACFALTDLWSPPPPSTNSCGQSRRRTRFLTFVEWASEDAIQIAREAAAAKHAEMKLNPREMFARLQIKADLADFAPVPGFPA